MIDVTERCLEFRKAYEAGNVYPGKKVYEDGVDIAFKNNLSLEYIDTEWCVLNWDDDFHAGLWWDEPLLRQIEAGIPERRVLIPTHVQPSYDPRLINRTDVWEDTRKLVGNVIQMYSPVKNVREEDFFGFCELRQRDNIIVEPCGVRDRLHWVPMMTRTDDVRKSPYAYIGTGYDLEFDDRLMSLGFSKMGFQNSFILHKGYVPLEPGQCPVQD